MKYTDVDSQSSRAVNSCHDASELVYSSEHHIKLVDILSLGAIKLNTIPGIVFKPMMESRHRNLTFSNNFP